MAYNPISRMNPGVNQQNDPYALPNLPPEDYLGMYTSFVNYSIKKNQT